MALFRKEIIEGNSNRWYGKSIALTRIPTSIVFVFTITIISLLLWIIINGNYTRRIYVNGEVISDLQPVNIFSTQQGFIEKKFIKQGDYVFKGQRLFQINIGKEIYSGALSDNSIKSVEEQSEQIKGIILKLRENKELAILNLQKQLSEYKEAYNQALKNFEYIKTTVNDMKTNVVNYKEYLKKGLINKDQFSNQSYLYYQQQNIYQNISFQLVQQKLNMMNIESEISSSSIDFDNKIAEYSYQLGELSRKQLDLDATGNVYINAPSDGRIESAGVTTGQMIKVGDILSQILPSGSKVYAIKLLMPNNAAPYVHIGDKVNIRFEAYPFQKYGQFLGTVFSISNIPAIQINSNLYYNGNDRNGRYENYYELIVLLDESLFKNKKLILANGMKAEITLYLDNRKIYQWILSPYYDIKKSLTGAPNEKN